nr:hypothetical protein [Tanacetum cinerariifolium]
MQSWRRMDYARSLVDIRAGRAFKNTMVILVPNLVGNGVMMHTINREYEWNPRDVGGTSNDGFQTIQRKGVRDPLVSKHGTRDNEKPIDDLVNGTRNKVVAPPKKTSIWSGRKAEYSSENNMLSLVIWHAFLVFMGRTTTSTFYSNPLYLTIPKKEKHQRFRLWLTAAHVKVGTSGCVSQPDWSAVICGVILCRPLVYMYVATIKRNCVITHNAFIITRHC